MRYVSHFRVTSKLQVRKPHKNALYSLKKYSNSQTFNFKELEEMKIKNQQWQHSNIYSKLHDFFHNFFFLLFAAVSLFLCLSPLVNFVTSFIFWVTCYHMILIQDDGWCLLRSSVTETIIWRIYFQLVHFSVVILSI